MTNILITGHEGFLGRNLAARLMSVSGLHVRGVDVHTDEAELGDALAECDVIYHLAGVNRPGDPAEFRKVNLGLTNEICNKLRGLRRTPRIVFSSSIQASLDNPYGVSKREAEDVLLRFGAETGSVVRIYRLKNVFGKWSRPNYNSVVATFCHNIANELPIQISDPDAAIELSYVDDVVDAFAGELAQEASEATGLVAEQIPARRVTLGELAGAIQRSREIRDSLLAPDFSVPFQRQIYATYLSYVPESAWRSQLCAKRDNRGSLAEFLKSTTAGQIFLSRTLPGVVRGNHYHHTKAEKFFVVEGKGLLRMRQVQSARVVEFHLSGEDYEVVDIPPGYTHSIQNIGDREMVTLFWATEIFNPDRPDTYYAPVDADPASGLLAFLPAEVR